MGNNAVSYTYDAYGNTSAPSHTLNNPYQYNAEYTDSSTGLQYLRARYYEASQGRFITKDTELGRIEYPITRNLYTYCGNNPLNLTDPSGHGWISNAVSSVKKAAKSAVSWANKNIVQPVKQAANTAKNWVNSNVVQPVKSFVSNSKQAISNAYNTGKTAVQQKYNKVKQELNTAKNQVSKSWNSFKSDVSAKTKKAMEETLRFVCTTTDRIVKDTKEFVSNIDWDRVAQGAMVVAGGALVIAVGVGAIVSTGGLAAPAVAGLLAGSITTANVMVAGTLTAGIVATGFGISDVIEGAQDLGYGTTGNSEATSVNPIRDTVFKDNPELYYLTEAAVTYGAGYGSQIINENRTYVESTVGSNNSSSSNIETTTVGRWMSEVEYDKMKETGKVQMSPNGNTTYVANPANKSAYEKQAKPGSVYVEFDVDSSSIYSAGNEQWGQIAGPGSLYDRFNQSKGQPGITDMPDASNITIKGRK